jgi:hypothetical protein
MELKSIALIILLSGTSLSVVIFGCFGADFLLVDVSSFGVMCVVGVYFAFQFCTFIILKSYF